MFAKLPFFFCLQNVINWNLSSTLFAQTCRGGLAPPVIRAMRQIGIYWCVGANQAFPFEGQIRCANQLKLVLPVTTDICCAKHQVWVPFRFAKSLTHLPLKPSP